MIIFSVAGAVSLLLIDPLYGSDWHCIGNGIFEECLTYSIHVDGDCSSLHTRAHQAGPSSYLYDCTRHSNYRASKFLMTSCRTLDTGSAHCATCNRQSTNDAEGGGRGGGGVVSNRLEWNVNDSPQGSATYSRSRQSVWLHSLLLFLQ